MPIYELLPWSRGRAKLSPSEQQEINPKEFQEKMNQLINEFYNTSRINQPARNWMEMDRGFAPRLDISETEKEIIILADLPGMDEKDINLMLEKRVLTISGEKKVESQQKDRTYHRMERRYGSFQRSINLPVDVESKHIQASFKKGVLEVVITKPAEVATQRKTIPIKVG